MALMRYPGEDIFQAGTMMALPLTAALTYCFGTRWLKGRKKK